MFKDKLESLLHSKHMNLHELSVLTGIPYSTLYSIIHRGTISVKAHIVKKICEVLKISEDYFTENADPSNCSSPEEWGKFLLNETIESLCGESVNRYYCIKVIRDYILTNKKYILWSAEMEALYDNKDNDEYLKMFNQIIEEMKKEVTNNDNPCL